MQKKKHASQLNHPNLHIVLDVIGGVLVWRGLWTLADRYLFPNHPDVSAGIGVVLGLAILYFEDRQIKKLL